MAVVEFDIPISTISPEEYMRVEDGVLFNPKADKISEREKVILNNLTILKNKYKHDLYRIVVINGHTRNDFVSYDVFIAKTKEARNKNIKKKRVNRSELSKYL